MATPLSPRVNGPMSAWSASVLLDGCIPGANVSVLSLTRPGGGLVATGPANAGEARLALSPGIQLNQKDRLVAVQATGGQDSSPVSDVLAVSVAPAPKSSSELPNPIITSHLWEFGKGLQVLGAFPGAHVLISSSAGLLGQATADEGVARISLSLRLPAAAVGSAPAVNIVAEERAPPGFAFIASPPLRTVGTVNPLPVAVGSAFPVPTNPHSPEFPPPCGCDTSILIGGIVDGSTVTFAFARDPSHPEPRVFDTDTLMWVLSRPLDVMGEKIEVTQGMPDTERFESAPLAIAAGPAPQPAPPVFVAPCPGTERIGISGLLSGANLTLQINDDVFDAGQVGPKATTADLRVPSIPPGATITVTQQRCGLSASASATATELFAIGDPDLADTPIECSNWLRVVAATPGALLEVRSQQRGLASAPVRTLVQVPVTNPVMHVCVAPALSGLDEIWVAQLICSGPWFEGPHHPVEAVPALDPPKVLFPPVIGTNFVRVAALPGAVVEVFRWVDGGLHGFLGSGAVTDPDGESVHIYREFLAGEQVVVLQRFCSHFSALSSPSDVAVLGMRVFSMPIGQMLSFPSESFSGAPGQTPHEVQITAAGVPAATFTCHVDGSWSCTARAVNSEPLGTVTFELTFVIKDDEGVVFSKTLEGLVLPPNSGFFDQQGSPLPPFRHITWPWKPLHPPLESSFSDIVTWRRILDANGTFSLDFATWTNMPFTAELGEDQVPPA